MAMKQKITYRINRVLKALYVLPVAFICFTAQAQTIIMGNDMKIEGKTITYSPDTKAKGDPLYIVKETSGAETRITKDIMEAIDPGRIKSIDVIKDATARELYGRRARYGAVIITLKEASIEGSGVLNPEKAKPSPLIILRQSDGQEKEITQAEMEAIDPSTIKSMDIKKDKAATEQFGPKASDGVIIIRMK